MAACEKVCRISLDLARIGHEIAACDMCALVGLDHSMKVVCAFRRIAAQPIGYSERQQGSDALSRRGQAEDFGLPQADRERMDHAGAVGLEIAPEDRASDPLQIERDLAPHIAAIEIRQTRV